ncbi:MAG: hypothetical protein ACM65M_15105 [Microcoleus sp.]
MVSARRFGKKPGFFDRSAQVTPAIIREPYSILTARLLETRTTTFFENISQSPIGGKTRAIAFAIKPGVPVQKDRQKSKIK